MKFISLDHQKTVDLISDSLTQALNKGQSVLWLVSGGSNIQAQVDVMNQLNDQAGGLTDKLTILPVDERYGPSGHADSNYQQMKQAGFNPGRASWVNVLGKNLNFDETISYYNQLMKVALDKSDYGLAILGIGEDGHTAGLLPGSSALNSTQLIAGYRDRHHRMTMTPKSLMMLNQTFVMARGDNKLPVLDKLKGKQQSITDMPSMLLYDLKSCIVISD